MKIKRVTIFLILMTILFFGCSHEEVINPNYIDVTVHKAKIEKIEDIRRFSGRIESQNEIEIYPKVSGKITKINYVIGDTVTQEDILFEIDEEDFKRRIDILKKQLIQAEASLDKDYRITKSTYEQSKINYERLKKDYENYKALYQEGAISNQNFLTIKNSYRNSKIEYEKAKESFDIISGNSKEEISESLASLNTLKSQIENAKKEMSDLRVKSPINGIISRVYVNKGERYNFEKPALIISGNQSMKIEISAAEHIVNYLQSGKQVSIKIDSIKENIKGIIEGVSPMAHSYTGTYPVRITFENNLNIKSGMFANVYIPIIEKNCVVIPRKSIIKEDGKNYVYVISPEMKAIKSFVTTGIDDGINIEIVSGIKNGDLVVNRGMEYLEDNDIVEIVKNWE